MTLTRNNMTFIQSTHRFRGTNYLLIGLNSD
jgi:hypothetical protein